MKRENKYFELVTISFKLCLQRLPLQTFFLIRLLLAYNALYSCIYFYVFMFFVLKSSSFASWRVTPNSIFTIYIITLYTLTLGNLYLHAQSLFHRIPVYADSDRSSIHIQEHSRHRSCKDRFHTETDMYKKIAGKDY